ncbi:MULTISPECIES: TIGR01619 family protein [Basfia]|uniref:TIGR01619 family protein n=1 Tax=Mannheimia succiniciproducens (strain KCTC 0769BP / MBEL55E) TaxID=221988 RepID=Q65TQ4_MANSM|nr:MULTISPECIES: TIGR01619 family protein [Basfia]AAU37656.1 unknown [[Mannheimia] succiniciproducens MBEL55E]SEP72882.1 TIGR01619 family protein [Basfia succiniciproducens]
MDQNWQTYRTLVNDHIAIFSANLAIFEQFSSEAAKLSKVVQFSIGYCADENGLPQAEEHQLLFRNILRALTNLSALSDTLYAGHIVSNGKAKLYFYTNDTDAFIQVLNGLGYTDDLDIQDDPNWDIYFDFLLPSPLESKMNATEEILDLLVRNGRDLADIFLVEHTFYFEDKENLLEFIESAELDDVSFNALKYTDEPVPVNDEEMLYMAKIEQELTLNNNEIFTLVEKFEHLAHQYFGEYVGWECDELEPNRGQLN